MNLNVDRLLSDFEPLNHSQRLGRMVSFAKGSQDDPAAGATLVALGRGNFYQRMLALKANYGCPNDEHLLAFLGDRSRLLRSMAIRAISRLAEDGTIREAFERLSERPRRQLFRCLVQAHRQTAIDAYVADLAQIAGRELASTLPFASDMLVRAHLNQAQPMMRPADWGRLASRQPAIALDALGTLMAEGGNSPEIEPRWVACAQAALPALSRFSPDKALELVRRLLPFVSLGKLDLGDLALQRPGEVADLAIATADEAELPLSRLALRLDGPRLSALMEREKRPDASPWTTHRHRGADSTYRPMRYRRMFNYGETGEESIHPLALLRRLPAKKRAELMSQAPEAWRAPDGTVPLEIVELMPRELRESEARRHLSLAVLAATPDKFLPYAAYLSWEEGQAFLSPYYRHPDPLLRAASLCATIRAVRFNRDRLAEVLSLVYSHRNEPEPVMRPVMSALSTLPPSAWRPEHLAQLDQLLTYAIEAPDASTGLHWPLYQLVSKLLPGYPDFVARWFDRLMSPPSFFYRVENSPRFEDRLSDADMPAIGAAFLPILQKWMNGRKRLCVLSLASDLGRRFRAFPALIDLIEVLALEDQQPYALLLLGRHARERFERLVPVLIASDPSWIYVEGVNEYLHRHRQDLLTPFLANSRFEGRFCEDDPFVMPARRGFERWTDHQQARFEETLHEVANGPFPRPHKRLSALAPLTRLPEPDMRRLAPWIAPDAESRFIRENLLCDFGKLDDDRAVPLLLEALQHETARVAIYALRRPLLEMAPSQALAFLQGMPRDRMTVSKEVIRLMGELSGEAATEALRALSSESLHRDIRAALTRALWQHLEEAWPWPLLETEARSKEAARAMVVARIPFERLSIAARERLAPLVATLLVHPDTTVRLTTLKRFPLGAVPDAESRIASHLVALLRSPVPEEAEAALNALFEGPAAFNPEVPARLLRQNLSDRPIVARLVRATVAEIKLHRRRFQALGRAVLTTLAADPLTGLLRAEVAVEALSWEELASFLQDQVGSAAFHAEAWTAVFTLLQPAAERRRDLAGLATLEAVLRNQADPHLRRVALQALVGAASGPSGWSKAHRQSLARYREDPAPLVAAAAQFIDPKAPSV